MPDFKLISSNFAKLHLSDQKIYTLEKNRNDLAMDLPRTSYFAKDLTVQAIKERLTAEFFSGGRNNVYLQGGIDGGTLKLLTLDYYTNTVVPYLSATRISTTDVVDEIRVCYLNDHDVLCGFSIQIFQDVESKAFHYALAVYRDITNLPEEREVTCIVDPILLNKDLKAQNLPAANILNVLKEKLQSTVLYEAIASIIANQPIASKEAFDELNTRLSTNENGYELIQLLNQYHQQLDAARDSKKDKLLNQSFLRRHSENLLLITAAALLGVGAVLALIFITAPLTAVIAGALVIVGAAVTAGITAVKCWRDEKALNAYRVKRDDRISKVEVQLEKEMSEIKKKSEPTLPDNHRDRIFSSPIEVGAKQATLSDEHLPQPQNPSHNQ